MRHMLGDPAVNLSVHGRRCCRTWICSVSRYDDFPGKTLPQKAKTMKERTEGDLPTYQSPKRCDRLNCLDFGTATLRDGWGLQCSRTIELLPNGKSGTRAVPP